VLTPTHGEGVGETLRRASAHPGDLVLADRGYCTTGGSGGAGAAGRRRHRAAEHLELAFVHGQGQALCFAAAFAKAAGSGHYPAVAGVRTGTWPDPAGPVVCGAQKPNAAGKELRKIRRKAQKGGPQVKPETLAYAQYVMVFTTLPGRTVFQRRRFWNGIGCAGRSNWCSNE
jgi:hypothetical protein